MLMGKTKERVVEVAIRTTDYNKEIRICAIFKTFHPMLFDEESSCEIKINSMLS
jgi:hypothetical protein